MSNTKNTSASDLTRRILNILGAGEKDPYNPEGLPLSEIRDDFEKSIRNLCPIWSEPTTEAMEAFVKEHDACVIMVMTRDIHGQPVSEAIYHQLNFTNAQPSALAFVARIVLAMLRNRQAALKAAAIESSALIESTDILLSENIHTPAPPYNEVHEKQEEPSDEPDMCLELPKQTH